MSEMGGQVTWSDLGLASTRTYQEPSTRTKERTGKRSSKKRSASSSRAHPICLCLRGGWPYSGCIYDDMGRWSVAWRLHDSQFWGVAQRRKRIALVADFGGLCALEVLFERKGLRWYPPESGETWQGISSGTEGGSGKTKEFAMQRFDEFKKSDKASSLKERDWKDSTDLITEGGERNEADGKTSHTA